MIDPETLIRSSGYVGLFSIIFIKTGLLAGFFLPGDTLPLAAGGLLSLPLTIIYCIPGSFSGDQLGYFIGSRLGSRAFNRPESRLFDPQNAARARGFFDRFGPAAIIIAQFVPVLRAFVPTMAGVSRFPYATFVMFSSLGAALWGASLTVLGYFVVSAIPALKKYIELIVIAGVLAGLLPSL